MKIDGIEVRKIPGAEKRECAGLQPGPAVVYFDGSPLCASCFGQEILEGDHRQALAGHLFSVLLDD
jgi:hypothetical protein